jgi:Ca2+-binding RTX toxin-like protein
MARPNHAAVASLVLSAATCAFGVPQSASATVGATCQGEPVTIAGEGQERLDGTPGRDVILSNGARAVWGHQGDDVICINAGYDNGEGLVVAKVEGNYGDDQIHVTATDAITVFAYLGPGDDEYSGGPGADLVYPYGGRDLGAQGHDTISTGAGSDSVLTGIRGDDQADDIDLGSGRDTVQVSFLDGEQPSLVNGLMDGGSGVDTLQAFDGDEFVGGNVVIDNVDGSVEVDGDPWLRHAGFETFDVAQGDTLTFRGTSADETLRPYYGRRGLDADMGGGDDTVALTTAGNRDITVTGGSGRDQVRIEATTRTLTLDLAQGAGEAGTGPGSIRLSSVEDTEARTRGRLNIRGSAKPDRIHVVACVSTVAGGAGDDQVSTGAFRRPTSCTPQAQVFLGAGDDQFAGSRGRDEVHGGSGADVMLGDRGADVLLGGPGVDRAVGGPAADTCRAETRRTCEA